MKREDVVLANIDRTIGRFQARQELVECRIEGQASEVVIRLLEATRCEVVMATEGLVNTQRNISKVINRAIGQFKFREEAATCEVEEDIYREVVTIAMKSTDMNPIIVEIKTRMDNIVEDIKEIDVSKEEIKAIYQAKVNQLTDSFNEKDLLLNARRDKLITEFKMLSEQVDYRETKTQRKVELLSGEVVIKKAVKKIDYDKKNSLIGLVPMKGMNLYRKKL